MQGIALGSLFWGYCTTQVLGGVLAMKFGGKIVFTLAFFVSSLATIATPLASQFHFGVLVALRILIGLCNGFVFPAVFAIFMSWVPPSESNRLIGGPMAGKFSKTKRFCIRVTCACVTQEETAILFILFQGSYKLVNVSHFDFEKF